VAADPLERAWALMSQARHAEAARLTAPIAANPNASHDALAAHVQALKGSGRLEEALAFDTRAVARFPASAVAWHNYAATLGDLGRGAESKAAAERAFARGLYAAETFGVYARALMAVGDLDASERAYGEALKRSPAAVPTAIELSNLIWMRRADLEAASAPLNQCLTAGGDFGALIAAHATLIEAAGDPTRAAELMLKAVERAPRDLWLILGAVARLVAVDRLDEAERAMGRALRLAPRDAGVAIHGVIVDLAAGRPASALTRARQALSRRSNDQALWGWAATAARAAGDPLYEELCDWPAMVGVYDLPAPEGWAHADLWLRDLGVALDRLHGFSQHPPHQSLRQGSQTMHRLDGSDDPAIRAFFAQIQGPLRDYMMRVGQGEGPLRGPNTGRARIAGAWSVKLQPGGHHRDHFHSEGWLSSAFYVKTPDEALDSPEREGWLRFGQPPFKTQPPLGPAHFVRPKPGRLVLFPSYMWHGTVPFTTRDERLTIAFDVKPA
jgi:tetratricopeptide (TPR) repeat protein